MHEIDVVSVFWGVNSNPSPGSLVWAVFVVIYAHGPKAKAKQSRHSFLLGSRPQRLTEWSNEIMDMMSQAWPAADVFIPLENKRRTRLFVRTP